MALRCYPLAPGGLLLLEAILLGLTSPASIYHETEAAAKVILLLIFMVAGIYFLKDLLLFVFARILLGIRSKIALSLTLCCTAAVLSAFLDALTVTAFLITVMFSVFAVYHRIASGKGFYDEHDSSQDATVLELNRNDLQQLRAFLRSLVMHAAVGTTLGGVLTLVGEPQNLLIGSVAGWGFIDYFLRMAPVSLPVFVIGLATCWAVERWRFFGYGVGLPARARAALMEYDAAEQAKRTAQDRAVLVVQSLVVVFLVTALILQWAEVGLIGLGVIVLATAFSGIVREEQMGPAFTGALPFTALLVVFFGIVAIIHDQELFGGVIQWAMHQPPRIQPLVFFLADGVLSAISDNVFVATIYISEVKAALDASLISREHFDLLAVAISTGTNIPSVATPNGQAAFLFLLTSALAPLIRLSYGRMVWMALPYTLSMTAVGLLAVWISLN